MKNKSVPIQKGPIKCNEPTMKHRPILQRTFDDLNQNREINSGQTLNLMTPKQK